ncbi:MAG TPA: TAXI family TRAP transporter solute-binding subunit [Anaeromyxobacteraceae bacterium]|nr:TAXI family TRAP transporter solute-binding subunit [Anaeromyxobacteraceae bacterium]
MVSSRHLRRAARVELAAVAVVAAAAVVWVGWAMGTSEMLAPRTIVMATGPEGGAYSEVAARYRDSLERRGLKLRLRATEGDAENLALLRDRRSGVAAALLQSGMTRAERSPDLASLGTVFYEPLWLFRASAAAAGGLEGLAGKRVAAGGEGSGTRAAVLELLSVAGVDPRSIRFVPLPPPAAAEALLRREIDAMLIVASWDSPVVRRLVASAGIEVEGIRRADAYVALAPGFEKLSLPMGVGDMANNRPSHDTTLLGLKVSLVVREDLNAAVQYLLLEAASEVHAPAGLFQKAGQFPAAEGADLPLSAEARRFYRSGRPFLQRYLPYWVAVVAERLLLALLPVVGLLIPLVRVLPAVYSGMVRRRIVRLYGELKVLEAELEVRRPGEPVGDLCERLDALESRAGHLRVPLRFAHLPYTLRQHIELVREKAAARAQPEGAIAGGAPPR